MENWHQHQKSVYGTLSTTRKASELTFKKPKQETPDIQSTNLTQD